MGLKIETGLRSGPTRTLLYGGEGIGKSTLAAQWPKPVILDTEDGTGRIECSRVRCANWQALYDALISLGGDLEGFETVVIDSIDWAEREILDAMLRKDGKRSVEDYGFGKGFVKLAEQFAGFLKLCDTIVGRGAHVVLVGHATVKRTTPPDMDEGWDRYELKLSKGSTPLAKEWADAILFVNYRTRLVEGPDGRTRARGGKERVIHTERSPAFDAKNRFGLAPEVPMSIEALAPLFAGVVEEPPSLTRSGAGGDPPLFDQICAYVDEARDPRALGKIGDRVEVLASEGQLTFEEAKALEARIGRRHDEISPPQEVTS
jgi:hypothetical protein